SGRDAQRPRADGRNTRPGDQSGSHGGAFPMTTAVIDVRKMERDFQMGDSTVRALRDVSLRVDPGEYVAIIGPSGSGKTTLMNLIGCLDTPTAGEYFLDGEEVSLLDDDSLS